MKILIIESNAHPQRQLRTILASLGNKSGEIEAATDAKAALGALSKKRFDCIFVSTLAKLDAVSVLKSIHPEGTSKVPTVVYGPKLTKESLIAAAEAGATAFLG